MTGLFIKDVPETIRERLKNRAKLHHRSLGREALLILEEVLTAGSQETEEPNAAPEKTDPKEDEDAAEVPFYKKVIAHHYRNEEVEGYGPNWSNVDDYDIPTILRGQTESPPSIEEIDQLRFRGSSPLTYELLEEAKKERP